MYSPGNVQGRNNNSKKLLSFRRRRYRDRIWCLSPESWLALSFFQLVMGLSILNTGYCVADDSDRELVMKFGAFVLCSGWAALIFLVERVKSRNFCRRFYINNPRPEFVGVSIPPPIQPEFLSALLLPEIEREWVSAETLPGFEPRHAEIVRPPTQQTATASEKNGGEESRSKRRRNNNKKKANNSVSELDAATAQESNESIVQITTVDANQEDGQPRDLSIVGELPSKVIKQECEQDLNQPNKDCEQQSIQKGSQPRYSNQDGDNPNKLISRESDQDSQECNQQQSSKLNDTSKENTSAGEKVVGKRPASDHHRQDSRQTSEDSLQDTDGPMSEESVMTTMNFISSQDQLEKSEQTSSPNQTYVDDNSEQPNKMPGQLGGMAKTDSDIPKENEESADQTIASNTTLGGMQQNVSKPVSPDFKTFTSKKRNRRRKK